MIALAEHVEQHRVEIADLVLVNMNSDKPICSEQLLGQHKSRIHHGEPISMQPTRRFTIARERLRFLACLTG